MASKQEIIGIPVPKDPFTLEPITSEQIKEVWEGLIRPALKPSADADRKPSQLLRTVMAVLTAVEPALDER